MTEIGNRGYASWDPRGYYHYHERPGGQFITKERYLTLLTPTIGGYIGYGGQAQPYSAIVQILGPGMPTTGHQWWRTEGLMDMPTTDIALRIGIQYMVEVTAMDSDGNVTTKRLFTKIGKGFDVAREEAMINDYLTAGTVSPPKKVDDWDELEEIDRVVVELDWQATPGMNPFGPSLR